MSMINTKDILETIKMIEEEHLDIRTITMGISLRDLASSDIHVLADKVYDKITRARKSWSRPASRSSASWVSRSSTSVFRSPRSR